MSGAVNVHHVRCNLKEGVRDTDFTDRATANLEHPRSDA